MAGTAELGPVALALPSRRERWQRRLLRFTPPQLTLAALLLGSLAHGLGVDALFGVSGGAGGPGAQPLIGAALAAIGLMWTLWAIALQRAAGNPIRPTDAPRVLVDEGPYRFSRHPMYLGLASLPLALGLALASPALWVAAVALAMTLDGVHIAHEERVLGARFGGWWRDYAASVRRWC